MDDFHPPSTTSCSRLDNYWETDFPGYFKRLIAVFNPFFGARKDRHTFLDNRLPGADLISHDPHDLGSGPYEGYPAILADLGKGGVFREKSISGMDCFSIGQLGSTNDRIDIQITLQARGRADANALIGKPDMQGFAVGRRINGNRL